MIFDFLFTSFEDQVKNWVLGGLEFVFKFMGTVGGEFWENPIVEMVAVTVFSICNAILVCSIIMMISNIATELSEGGNVSWSLVFKNLFKGIAFTECIVFVPGLFYSATIEIIKLLPMGQLDTSTKSFGNFVSNIVDGIGFIIGIPTGASFLPMLIILIFLLVGGIVYLVFSLLLFTHLFTHMIASTLYVHDIINGDSTAMGSWFRTAISFSLTFVIQSLLFFVGTTYVLSSDVFSGDFMFGVGCILGIFGVAKALSKYGYSVGVSSVFKAAGGAASTAGSMVMMGGR